jgi:quercetin dioxygenase-like cupin family protein
MMKGKVKTMRQTQLRKRHGTVPILSVLTLAGLYVGYLSGLISPSGTALATPSSLLTPTILARALALDEIDVKTHTGTHQARIKTKGLSDVYIVSNRFAPGGHTGWHTHLGPSVLVVKAGTATYYDGDDPTCMPHVAQVGEGFVDRGGGHVHLVRNEGEVELEVIAFQLTPGGADRRIDAPNPGNCPF